MSNSVFPAPRRQAARSAAHILGQANQLCVQGRKRVLVQFSLIRFTQIGLDFAAVHGYCARHPEAVTPGRLYGFDATPCFAFAAIAALILAFRAPPSATPTMPMPL